MGFIFTAIAWFFSTPVGQYLLQYELGKITDWVKGAIAKKEAQKKNAEEAAKSVAPLQKAQTAEEIDAATDDALDKL